MVIAEHSLIEPKDLVDEECALNIIEFWEFRSSLFSQYDLPNMESLWIILVKATIAKQRDQILAIDALAIQFDQSVGVISRIVDLLAKAGLLVRKETSNIESQIEISILGEKLVAEGLAMIKP